jgi:hypothetical protein
MEFDEERTLENAPPGGLLSILVTVELEPANAGCRIYGKRPGGIVDYVEVHGSGSVELPFENPEIGIKYLPGLKRVVRISTHGWRDARR